MKCLKVFLLAVCFPLVAQAQTPKQVEVVNLPEVQDVWIVGPAAPVSCREGRFQLVGFTAASYTGNMGGRFGVTRKCQLEFPGSQMCNELEIRETTTIPDGLTGAAWVDEYPTNPWNQGDSCQDWVSESNSGDRVLANGSHTTGFCANPVAIACCALVP
jgi:hypothetical protein